MIGEKERPDASLRPEGAIAADVADAEQLGTQAQLIRNVNDNTTELIFMKDRAGRLIYANAATLRLMGKSVKDVGTADSALFHDDAEYGPIHAHDLRVMETGESITVEEPYTGADGLRRVFRSTKSPLFDDAGEVVGVIGVSTDITSLRASEDRQRFRLMLNDALRALTDAREIERTTCRLLREHLHADQVRYRETVDADVPIEKLHSGRTAVCRDITADPSVPAAGAAALRRAGIRAYITVPLVKDGVWVAMLAAYSVEPRSWTTDEIALVEEIADRTWAVVRRVRAEAALRTSEEDRDLALRAAEMGTWDYDLVADVFHFDARAQEQYCLPSGPLDHRPEGVAAVVHPDDVAPMFDAIRRASDASGDGRYDIDYRIAQGNGHYRWLRAWGKAEFDGKGAARRAVRIVGVSRDVTLEKEAERHRECLNHELVDSRARLIADLTATQQLQAVSTELIADHHPEALFAQLLDAAMALTNADGASVQRFDPEGPRLSLLASRNFHPASEAYWQRVDANSKTSCGRAMVTNTRVLVEDTETSPELHDTQDLLEYRRCGFRAVQSTPLVSRDGRRLGVLSTHWREPRRPGPDDLGLFDVLTRLAADAIDRKQADEALSEELRNTRILHGLGVRQVTAENIQSMYEEILSAAIEITRAKAGTVQILDHESEELVLLATRGFSRRTEEYFHRVDARANTSCGLALRTGHRSYLNFDATSTDVPTRLHVEDGVLSAQSSPLVSRSGKAIGMVSTHWDEADHRLSERELRSFDLLARQAADLLEQRAADEALRRSEERQAFLLKLSDALRPLTDPVAIQKEAMKLLVEHLGLVRAAFYDADEDEDGMTLAASVETNETTWPARLRMSDFAPDIYESYRAGEVYAVNDTERDPRLSEEGRAALRALGIQRLAGVPLVKGERLSSVLGVHAKEPRDWRVDELRLLEDVTERTWATVERTRAEAALRISEAQLKEADRRKDEFLAMLAHELRNPLAPISTGLELIRVAGDKPAGVERVRKVMERQVAHMVRLIDDLMDVSRITSGKIALQREPTPLNSMVSSAVDSNRPAIAAKGVHLTVELPEPTCVVDVDPTRFVQVISNLLHNATKFTDDGDTIVLRGRVHDRDTFDERRLTLVVADSGHGITPEFLPHVFDLFAQEDTGALQSGLGIGLALSRRLIEMHGGTIEVRSEGRGLGSEFVIRMPVLDELPRPRSEGVANSRVDCRVLVIDDNRDAADTLTMLVEELGGKCRSAYGGESGLREMRRHRPDIVLLDIGMSGLNGYETCRRIRQEHGGDVVLVAVTGYGQRQDKEKAKRAGFDAHLTKPADPALLHQLLVQRKPG